MGWLPLTGTICDKNYFWRLLEHLKTAYGKDEFTLNDEFFQLPDVRGMFPRFANESEEGYDAGRRAGNIQSSASPNIDGRFAFRTGNDDYAGSFYLTIDGTTSSYYLHGS